MNKTILFGLSSVILMLSIWSVTAEFAAAVTSVPSSTICTVTHSGMKCITVKGSDPVLPKMPPPLIKRIKKLASVL